MGVNIQQSPMSLVFAKTPVNLPTSIAPINATPFECDANKPDLDHHAAFAAF